MPLPSLGENPDTSAFGDSFRKKNLVKRCPVQVSLGVHVDGAALPKPDLGDCVFLMAGEMKRILAAETELMDIEEIESDFAWFNTNDFRTEFVPLSLDQFMTFEEWLDDTNYPEWRKEELRKVKSELPDIELTDLVELWWREIGCFMKDETYVDYKYPRPIHAAVDQIKVVLGPIFRSIERVVFQNGDFIKKIPLGDRPAYIEERLHVEGVRPFAADANSWEARQTVSLMNASEMQLYAYMMQDLPATENLLLDRVRTVTGVNYIRNRFFSLQVFAKRMSGEMNTSLGNGVNMRQICRYVCFKKGSTVVRGVFEGDDSLVVCDGPLPTKEDFERLNVAIDLQFFDDVNEASFCGMVYDKSDLCNIPDPRECLVSFGWTTRDYLCARQAKLDMLLVAKGYSYLAAYAGCPVLQPLALMILAVIPHSRHEVYDFVAQHMVINMYERSMILDALRSSPSPRPIGTGSRYLMEKKYGFTVLQQYEVEAFIEEMRVDGRVRPIPSELLLPLKASWIDYYQRFSTVVDVSDGFSTNFPPDLARPVQWADGFVEQTKFTYAQMHAPF